MIKSYRILAVAALMLAAITARADSLRCGSDLLLIGQSTVILLAKCGDPILREPLNRIEVDRRGVSQVINYGERWTYNFGPSNFMQNVTIENGSITAIENGDRGF